MAEPTTALTDFLMAAVAVVLAIRIGGFWRYAFLFTASAALFGGIYHSHQSVAVWKITVLSVGLATFFLIGAAANATLTRRAARILMALALVQLITYSVWMMSHDEFIYVIADYGTGLLCTAVLYLIAYRAMPSASKQILGSIAVSAVGAYVQASGLSLHRHFNHNDLYHVIQIVALLLLYRGARASAISRSTEAASE